MFERFFKSQEEKEAAEQEKRAMNFQREQTAFSAGHHPDDDRALLHRQDQRTDLLRWQQELGDELEMFKHDLKNEEYINEQWVRREGVKPMLNDDGVRMLERHVRQCMSRNLMMSNLSETQIRQSLKYTCQQVCHALGHKYDVFEIDFIDLSNIMRMVINMITPTAFRAMNQGERIHHRTISKRLESYHETPTAQEQKKGIFGMFGGNN